MAATDTTLYPVYGQKYRTRFEFFDISTGLQHSGTLASLSATVSLDDGVPQAASGTLTQVGSSGICYLDLDETEMSNNVIVATPSTGTSGTVARAREIVPAYMVEPESPHGYWQNALSLDGVTPQIRLENMWMNISAAAMNSDIMNAPNGSPQHAVYTFGNNLMMSGVFVANTSGYSNRGQLS